MTALDNTSKDKNEDGSPSIERYELEVGMILKATPYNDLITDNELVVVKGLRWFDQKHITVCKIILKTHHDDVEFYPREWKPEDWENTLYSIGQYVDICNDDLAMITGVWHDEYQIASVVCGGRHLPYFHGHTAIGSDFIEATTRLTRTDCTGAAYSWFVHGYLIVSVDKEDGAMSFPNGSGYAKLDPLLITAAVNEAYKVSKNIYTPVKRSSQ